MPKALVGNLVLHCVALTDFYLAIDFNLSDIPYTNGACFDFDKEYVFLALARTLSERSSSGSIAQMIPSHESSS